MYGAKVGEVAGKVVEMPSKRAQYDRGIQLDQEKKSASY